MSLKPDGAEKPRHTIFDCDAYGVELRLARLRKGFKRGEDFCDVVGQWTGVTLNREALYRIEKGIQPPTVEQMLAFGLILYHGRGIEDVLKKTKLTRCVTPYAEYLAAATGSLEDALSFDGYMVFEDSYTHELMRRLPDEDADVSMIDDYYVDALDKKWEAKRARDEEEEALERESLLADLEASRWPVTLEDLKAEDDDEAFESAPPLSGADS